MGTIARIALVLIASLPQQPPADAGLGRISGRTISPTFEPVANTEVALACPPPAGSATTVANVEPTFFPGTVNVSEATLITIKAGDLREANFALVVAPTFTVAGVVQDASAAVR